MERDMNYDLELAKYIWAILKSNLPILMSWGVEIETVKVIACGLEFKVGKSSVSCPLKPSDSAPLKHSTMPP